MSINITKHEASVIDSAVSTISLLATFMILSLPNNPSSQLIELALSRIRDACEAIEPITEKFDA